MSIRPSSRQAQLWAAAADDHPMVRSRHHSNVRIRPWLAGLILVALTAGGCASTKSSTHTCTVTPVSPGRQAGAPTAKKALDAYLRSSNRASSIPASGYTRTGATERREVFENGDFRIVVSSLAVPKGEDPMWVVAEVVDCPGR